MLEPTPDSSPRLILPARPLVDFDLTAEVSRTVVCNDVGHADSDRLGVAGLALLTDLQGRMGLRDNYFLDMAAYPRHMKDGMAIHALRYNGSEISLTDSFVLKPGNIIGAVLVQHFLGGCDRAVEDLLTAVSAGDSSSKELSREFVNSFPRTWQDFAEHRCCPASEASGAFIHYVYVVPEVRNHGLAVYLLKEVVGEFLDSGAGYVLAHAVPTRFRGWLEGQYGSFEHQRNPATSAVARLKAHDFFDSWLKAQEHEPGFSFHKSADGTLCFAQGFCGTGAVSYDTSGLVVYSRAAG